MSQKSKNNFKKLIYFTFLGSLFALYQNCAFDSSYLIDSGAVKSSNAAEEKTLPSVYISKPEAIIKSSPSDSYIMFSISYKNTDEVLLTRDLISINATDTAKVDSVKILEPSALQRTVILHGISGKGNIGITLAPRSAKSKNGRDINHVSSDLASTNGETITPVDGLLPILQINNTIPLPIDNITPIKIDLNDPGEDIEFMIVYTNTQPGKIELDNTETSKNKYLQVVKANTIKIESVEVTTPENFPKQRKVTIKNVRGSGAIKLKVISGSAQNEYGYDNKALYSRVIYATNVHVPPPPTAAELPAFTIGAPNKTTVDSSTPTNSVVFPVTYVRTDSTDFSDKENYIDFIRTGTANASEIDFKFVDRNGTTINFEIEITGITGVGTISFKLLKGGATNDRGKDPVDRISSIVSITDSSALPPVENTAGYDVILVIGQSNTHQGEGLSQSLDAENPRIHQVCNPRHPDSRCIRPTGNPSVGAYKIGRSIEPLAHHTLNDNKVGFALSFAKKYITTIPNHRKVLIIPAGFGGSGFLNTQAQYSWDRHDPDGTGEGNAPIPLHIADGLYDYAVSRTEAAIHARENRLVAVLWNQGENDTNNEYYLTDLKRMINNMRHDLEAYEVPFITGGLSPAQTKPITENLNKFITACLNYTAFAPSRAENMGTTSYANALTANNGDLIHINAAGQREFGTRYFNAYLAAKNNDSADPTKCGKGNQNPGHYYQY